MEESYTLSTIMAAVEHITSAARVGGGRWERLWSSVESQYAAEQVSRIFGQDEWFVAVSCGKRAGLADTAFDLVEVVCERLVRRSGMFTRTRVGVI
jgi:hypothetical protein